MRLSEKWLLDCLDCFVDDLKVNILDKQSLKFVDFHKGRKDKVDPFAAFECIGDPNELSEIYFEFGRTNIFYLRAGCCELFMVCVPRKLDVL